jgi:cell wall-associated NlpC family hydrolase
MKRLTSVIAILLIAFAITAHSTTVRVYANGVNIRASPSSHGAVIGSVSQANLNAICQQQGENVSHQGKTNNWWTKVNANGKVGFISNLFLVGGHTIAGVPTCGGSSPAPQPRPNPSNNHNQPHPQPQPKPQPRPSGGAGPCNIAPNRQGIVAAAMWAANSGKYISYSQGGSRWSGITKHVCPYQGVPPVTDCSAFVTWLFWSAFGNGNDFINGQGWRAGYTGTMGSHGTSVSLAQARPGDIVLYGSGTYDHATLYVGNNKVVSFGSNGPAKLLPINYRSGYHIRSYLP